MLPTLSRQSVTICIRQFHCDFSLSDAEKKLLQAQHRLEEAQARDRVKERKARTRRLIQEGAILEKVLPEVRTMNLSALEDYLMQKLPQYD